MSPYRVAGELSPIFIEPERPWFPKLYDLVRAKIDPFSPVAKYNGCIGYVSMIKEGVYLVDFPVCQCRRSVDCTICRSRKLHLDPGDMKKPQTSRCALLFLQELELP